jgi:hypothetical protein
MPELILSFPVFLERLPRLRWDDKDPRVFRERPEKSRYVGPRGCAVECARSPRPSKGTGPAEFPGLKRPKKARYVGPGNRVEPLITKRFWFRVPNHPLPGDLFC